VVRIKKGGQRRRVGEGGGGDETKWPGGEKVREERKEVRGGSMDWEYRMPAEEKKEGKGCKGKQSFVDAVVLRGEVV